jgi:hypothetical protein
MTMVGTVEAMGRAGAGIGARTTAGFAAGASCLRRGGRGDAVADDWSASGRGAARSGASETRDATRGVAGAGRRGGSIDVPAGARMPPEAFIRSSAAACASFRFFHSAIAPFATMTRMKMISSERIRCRAA